MMSDQNKVRRIFCTDFSATADLTSLKKANSAVDAHAIIAVFFVYHNFRKVHILEGFTKEILSDDDNDVVDMFDDDGWIIVQVDEYAICDCDVRQYIGGTESKGKSNDHFYHNICLENVNNEFYQLLESQMKKKL